jgi:outer membrane protein assembly factor BamB
MRFPLAVLALGLSATPLLAAPPVPGRDWPGFRGIRAAGVDPANGPLEWNVAEGKGVAWKVPVPGLAHASPVVWDDKVCVVTAVGPKPAELKVGLYGDIAPVADEGEHEYRAMCFDRASGKLLWNQLAKKAVPAIKRHTKATHANATPATDGKVLVAMFGSEGLHAFDLATGKPLWSKDLGVLDAGFFMVPDAQWGFGSSPVIEQGVVYLQADVQKGSFLAAFDAATGKELWRTPRADVPTWGSPTPYEHGGQLRLAVNGFKHAGGYDAKTGAEVWRMKAGGDIPIPTPQVAHGLIFLTSSHGGPRPIYAVKTSAAGDVSLAAGATSNEQVTWSVERDGAYMPTPVVAGDTLFVLRDNGTVSAWDAKTGAKLFLERLGEGNSGYTASPVVAGDRLYLTSEEGETHVIRAGRSFERIGNGVLGETLLASPAVSGGTLYFRTRGHLVAIR